MTLIGGAVCPASSQEEGSSPQQLMPDWDASRKELLSVGGEGRFRTPEGFRVEQVLSDEQTGSVVNLTFDPFGRPLLAVERGGLVIVEDHDSEEPKLTQIASAINTAHGMFYLSPEVLLVHADGPEPGSGLYLLRDADGDPETPEMEEPELVVAVDGGIVEHGPHTITIGPDGSLYLLYGNMGTPQVEVHPDSPLRPLTEEQLLPRYLDPRGHANRIRAPAGTVYRVALEDGVPVADNWELILGGLRNPFDMAFSPAGELFIYEADMEWDRGLPWFRPTRVIHGIPSADYGWRTGSGKISFGSIDTLPSVVDVGRGSPVGVVFYEHDGYGERFRDALFLGDWSRGRIRVLFPSRTGATWRGEAPDFVLGEPLNVTDLDVGPDGLLYFTTGGRMTSGGLYRVAYDGETRRGSFSGVEAAIRQPMPRSAWGRVRIDELKSELGLRWEPQLWSVINNGEREAALRVRALEILQLHGPQPDFGQLERLLTDSSPDVRAAAVRLLGMSPLERVEAAVSPLFSDEDPLVLRRAVEALVRSGLTPDGSRGQLEMDTALALYELLDHEDRFVRYAAREAIARVDHGYWIDPLMLDTPAQHPRGLIEGILAALYRPEYDFEINFLAQKLVQVARFELDDEQLQDLLRVVELTLIRRREEAAERTAGLDQFIGGFVLEGYPHQELEIRRLQERLLAAIAPEGAIEALLAALEGQPGREDEIHIAYALRAIPEGWTAEQRSRFLGWFDRAWELKGAASMKGYIELIWDDALALATEAEREAAVAHREATDRARAERAAALMRSVEDDEPPEEPVLTQFSFDELAEYFEYDVMAYEGNDLEKGALVFQRARCADCHVFGDVGRGGGPDLSTVTKRFRRREILESIVDPSKVISDQYQGVDLELADGTFHSGFVVDEGRARLTLITATGERVKIRKSRIATREPARTSIMPEGLLDTMDLQDLKNLMAYLSQSGE